MVGRINSIIERESLTSSTFADTIHVSRGTITHILSGRNNPSLDVTTKILTAFPNINPDWLLMGKLPMYKSEKVFLTPEQGELFKNTDTIPHVKPSAPEYAKEIKVEKPVLIPENIEKQEFKQQNITSKNIDKIMIFYSDNTFLSFLPEK
jgi:DNA-binding XRE family transcriptional regulator